MRKSFWIVLVVMVVAVSAPSAHADGFTWSFASGIASLSGSGTFTATPVSGTDQELVTAITGTFGGQAITGLLPAGTTGPNGSTDNLIFPAGDAPNALPGFTSVDAFFTMLGLGFSTGSQAYFFNTNGFACAGTTCNGNNLAWITLTETVNGTFTLTPVAAPEPASLLLLGSGLLGLAGIKRRRSGC